MYRGEATFSIGEKYSLEQKLNKQQDIQKKIDYILVYAPYLEVKNGKYDEIKENIRVKVGELLDIGKFEGISIEEFKYLDIWVVSQKILLEISTMDWKYDDLLNYIFEKYEIFKINYGFDNCESKTDYEKRCVSIIDDFIELGVIIKEGDKLSYRFKSKGK